MRKSALFCLLLGLSLVVPACGGDDDDGGTHTDKAWLCDDVHPSCPSEPAPEVACPVDAVRCVYSTGALCFCSSGAWSCP